MYFAYFTSPQMNGTSLYSHDNYKYDLIENLRWEAMQPCNLRWTINSSYFRIWNFLLELACCAAL